MPMQISTLGSWPSKVEPLGMPDRKEVVFAARSPEAEAAIASARADGAQPHLVLVHPDGWRTVLMRDRAPIVVQPYAPSYTEPPETAPKAAEFIAQSKGQLAKIP